MSDHQTNLTDKEGENLIHSNGTIQHEPDNLFVRLSSRFLDQGDSFIYAIVGLCFFLASFFCPGLHFLGFCQRNGPTAPTANGCCQRDYQACL